MGAETRELIVVAGVHRSGTSVMTACLTDLGAQTGRFHDPRDPDNPQGYFEHPAIRSFNDRVLNQFGATWDNWGFHPSQVDLDGDDASTLIGEGADLCNDVFASDGRWIVKDPRIAILAPLWVRILAKAGLPSRWVVIVRDPLEVAQSQMRRAERAPEFHRLIAAAEPMQALWSVTMHALLGGLPDDGAFMALHADLVGDPKRLLAVAAAYLDLEATPEEIDAVARSRIAPDLYRSRADVGTDIAGGGWTAIAGSLYSDLTRFGGARVLTKGAGQRLAAAQTGLTSLLDSLPAVRMSLASSQRATDQVADRADEMRHYLSGLSDRIDLTTPVPGWLMPDAAFSAGKMASEPELLVLTALVAEGRGDIRTAEECLTRLIALSAARPRGYKLLIGLHSRNGQTQKAVELAAKARKKFPGIPEFEVLGS